jgi:adenylate kinase family enzyme
MNKIVVIGSPGAGKSTFAQALGEILQIEVIHLDRHFWQAGWKELPREARIEIEQDLVRDKERWIIEGTYLGSSDKRLSAADTIIFLDLPRLLCLWRIVTRHIATYHQRNRLDIPDGCTDKLSLRCVLKVLVFPQRGRRQLMKKIKSIRACETNQSEQKTIHTFRSTEDLDAFLLRRSSQGQEEVASVEHMYAREVRRQRAAASSPSLAFLPSIQNTPMSINLP